MNQRNPNSMLGPFGSLLIIVVILLIVGLFLRVIIFLFPLIAIIVVGVILWRIIRNFIVVRSVDDEANERTNSEERQQRTKKDKSPKEPIDVEYTVLDDESSDKQKKNDR